MTEPPTTAAGGGSWVNSWASSDVALADAYDALLLDLDGVVYVGPSAVPGAARALAMAGERGTRAVFVTNNAARPPSVVAAHLRDLGVPAAADDVVTSAQAAAGLLAGELPAGARVLATGASGLREALTEAGLVPVGSAGDSPVAVVQGFSPDLDWAMLLETCVAVRAGLPWVATNDDATLPTPRGEAPGNGAFVEVVRATTGVRPRVAGKPYRPLLDEALRRSGGRRALVVGDRLDTDIEGARLADLPSLLVMTGVSRVPALLTAPPGRRPSYLSGDLGGLLRPHGAPVLDGDVCVEGEVRASWDSTASPVLVLRAPRPGGERDRPDITADRESLAARAVRVVCAAVWRAVDEGSRADVTADELAGAARQALLPWTVPVGWDR